jgi:hypothetical protein
MSLTECTQPLAIRAIQVVTNRRHGTTINKGVSSHQQTQADKLRLRQLTDWDGEITYDEDPPSYIHYTIEWKVRVNSMEMSKDTEQDMVLAPASYWRLGIIGCEYVQAGITAGKAFIPLLSNISLILHIEVLRSFGS